MDSSTHQKKDNTLKYQKAWARHLEVLEDVKRNYPNSYGGVLEKCYLLAINNTTRIYDKKRDKAFLQELIQFIKLNAVIVYKNKETRKKTKLLGLLGIINAPALILFCKIFFIVQHKAGITFRKTQ